MSTDRSSATDEILGRVYAILPALASIAGQDIEARWPNIEMAQAPDRSKYWIRTTLRTVDEPQAGLSVAVKEIGKRRFKSIGLVYVQIFCPQADVEANDRGDRMCVVIRDSFRAIAPSAKVTFKNARIQELAPEDSAIRFLVVAEYEYDEIA